MDAVRSLAGFPDPADTAGVLPGRSQGGGDCHGGEKAGVYLVSDLDKTLVERLFMRPFSTFQEAYDAAIAERGPGATVLAMPYGGSTLPNVIERLL